MSGAADRIKLTKRVVDSADINRGRHYLWDGELRGFGLQVEASGTKTYFVRYRPKGTVGMAHADFLHSAGTAI